MDNSPLPAPVNWEAVRMLALVVGVREAARRMQISQEAAMKRCQREGWLSSPEARTLNKRAIAERSGIAAPACPQLSATAVYQGELVALGQKTRLSLAKAVGKAGSHLETLDGAAIVAQSGDVKAIAQTADLVHGWKEQAPQVKIRLDVLNGGAEPIADVTLDVESEVISDWPESDPLDEY